MKSTQRSRFVALVQRIAPAASAEAAADAHRRLMERWNQPHRVYHNVDHLRACLRALDGHVQASVQAQDRLENPEDAGYAEMALWYHDAVYEIAKGARNEERSAELAAAELGRLGFPPHAIQCVVAGIMATRYPSMDDAAGPRGVIDLVRGCDLAGLAAPWNAFLADSDRVFAEYGVDRADARALARAWILRALILDEILATQPFRGAFAQHQAQAHANVHAAMALALQGAKAYV